MGLQCCAGGAARYATTPGPKAAFLSLVFFLPLLFWGDNIVHVMQAVSLVRHYFSCILRKSQEQVSVDIVVCVSKRK